MTENHDKVVISVENLSKKFCRQLKRSLAYGFLDMTKDIVGIQKNNNNLRKGEFWALQNVSFQLKRGEALGLVGTNGAGKSTLLRIMSGLIKPDMGRVTVRGSVAPLIALKAGFKPVLTGRENIYSNMSILGLTSKEIEGRFQDVIEFAEVSDAIDAPLQTYSSGMAARLGFACAVHTNPDILLVDEVLAVGDIKFRMKCYHKLAELRENGTALILVSHNTHTILNVCDSAIYLSKGKMNAYGETEEIVRNYENDLNLDEAEGEDDATNITMRPKNEASDVEIVTLFFRNEQREIISTPLTGEAVYFCVECKVYKEIYNGNLCVSISALIGEYDKVLYLTSMGDNETLKIFPGDVELQLYMPFCCLKPDRYRAKVFIKEGLRTYDVVESFKFVVKSNKVVNKCLFYQPRSWKIISEEDDTVLPVEDNKEYDSSSSNEINFYKNIKKIENYGIS